MSRVVGRCKKKTKKKEIDIEFEFQNLKKKPKLQNSHGRTTLGFENSYAGA
jgi:hypothetical protein